MRTEPSVRAWVTVSFALALLAVVVIALVSDGSTTDLLSAEEWVGHAYEGLALIQSIESSTAVAHNGVRGYALTGDERFLADYRLSAQEALARAGELRKLTADNQEQLQRIDRLDALLIRLTSWLGETVALRREHGLAAVAAKVGTFEGEALAVSLGKVLDEMAVVERRFLARRTAVTWQTASRTLWVVRAGGAIGCIIVLAASVVIGRDVSRRRRLERILQESEDRYRGLFERNRAGIVRVGSTAGSSTAMKRACACWATNRGRWCSS